MAHGLQCAEVKGDVVNPTKGREKGSDELDHLRRLEELERELALLRRQLQDESGEIDLPSHDFQALVFEVGGSSFAVPISIVREIVRYVKLTHIADVPLSVVGVMNVRGEVLPVIDARLRLGEPASPPTLSTPILLLATQNQSFGLIVDAVDTVSVIRASEVSRPTGKVAQSACVSGITTQRTRVVQLLDAARTLSVHQWKTLHARISERPSSDESDEKNRHKPQGDQ